MQAAVHAEADHLAQLLAMAREEFGQGALVAGAGALQQFVLGRVLIVAHRCHLQMDLRGPADRGQAPPFILEIQLQLPPLLHNAHSLARLRDGIALPHHEIGRTSGAT